MRVVTPDTSLWEYLSSFFDTLGGLQALVLIACVIGVITGGVLWAVGAGADIGPLASRGRWAVIGTFGAAAAAAVIGALIATVIVSLS